MSDQQEPAVRVVESFRGDHGELIERLWVRRSVGLDRAEMPCVDCHVGEPHCCPLLTEKVVVTYG